MKIFTTYHKNISTLHKCIAVSGWILIWYLASLVIKQEMLLASPVSVAKRLAELVITSSFWKSILFSLSRMASGFFLALASGIVLAAAAYRFRCINVFLHPFMGIVKATPVASYTILCLLFISSRNLSVCISFLMALPVIYQNVLQGLVSTDQQLLEMAKVYKIPLQKQIPYIYFSQLMPFLISACSLSLGLCWKSGIAAEVIGLPGGSIGSALYQAKIFVDTKTLLAWTVVIILLSFLFEKVFMAALNALARMVERR